MPDKLLPMKRFFFRFLARLNKVLLPSMAKRDLARLPAWAKLLVAYRYWVTTNSLE
jgi:hypothetical protein